MKFLYLSAALLIASSLVAMNNEDHEGHNRSLYQLNNLDIFREEIKARIKKYELSKPKEPNSLCGIIRHQRLKYQLEELSPKHYNKWLNKQAKEILGTIKDSCDSFFSINLSKSDSMRMETIITGHMIVYLEKESIKKEFCKTISEIFAKRLLKNNPDTEHKKRTIANFIRDELDKYSIF